MTDAQGTAAARLRSFIERIERLEEEKQAIADDIREIYSEAKSTGFDPKIMRQVIRLRKMDRQEREEQEQVREVYMEALGELASTPLGKSAISRATGEREEAVPHDPDTGEIMDGRECNEDGELIVDPQDSWPDSAVPETPPDRITASLSGLKNTLAAVG